MEQDASPPSISVPPEEKKLDGRFSSSLKDRLKKCGRYRRSLSPSSSSGVPRKKVLQTKPPESCSKTQDIVVSVTRRTGDLQDVNSPGRAKTFRSSDSEKNNLILERRDINFGKEDTRSCTDNNSDSKVDVTRTDDNNLSKAKFNLMQRLTVKNERKRKLLMVKMYRSKNDPSKLSSLIAKWKQVSQEAVLELHQSTTGEPKPTITQVMQHLGLDFNMLSFDAEEESFQS